MSIAPSTPSTPPQNEALLARYARVRGTTRALAAPLGAEDACAQSMPEASPAKWHLAHTTWFFENFVLGLDPGYKPHDPRWHRIFNSYYRSVGSFHARPERGLLTRPTLDEVLAWREAVDENVLGLLARRDDAEWIARVTLGLHHEQQHQELLLTDIKHLFSRNPLAPVYQARERAHAGAAASLQYLDVPEGVIEIGASREGFAYDNERPRHRVIVHPCRLANRLVTNREYRAFIEDGAYRTPALWLSDGWDQVERHGWRAPLYWNDTLDAEFTLAGLRPIDPDAPVAHVSQYEADAFARWAGARLPREEEWEAFAAAVPVEGNLLDAGELAPCAAGEGWQIFGDCWEWTQSAYDAYPGFTPLAGALGEYNGKFMSGQRVLRGGSCVTPADHIRASYRNFFAPHTRWQFSGIRLARDA